MSKTRKLRVMIADDESHVRKYIKAVLGRMNCEIIAEAADGADAVEQFLKLKPHLLLLDINMPIKSGKTALKEIVGKYPKAFVIMLTSLVDRETIEECINLGAYGYIRKDLPVEDMKSAIRQSWRYYKASKERHQNT